jgi:hypothetical protein
MSRMSVAPAQRAEGRHMAATCMWTPDPGHKCSELNPAQEA